MSLLVLVTNKAKCSSRQGFQCPITAFQMFLGLWAIEETIILNPSSIWSNRFQFCKCWISSGYPVKWGILCKRQLWRWPLDPIGREHFNKFLESQMNAYTTVYSFSCLPCTEKQAMALCARCRQRSHLLPFCEVYSASWVYFFFKHLIRRTYITSDCSIDLLACSSL